MTERLDNIVDFVVKKKEVVLRKYVSYKMKQQGYTFVGCKDNLYYGVTNNDKWQFYYVYGMKIIPIAVSDNRLKAKFTYSVLLQKN